MIWQCSFIRSRESFTSFVSYFFFNSLPLQRIDQNFRQYAEVEELNRSKDRRSILPWIGPEIKLKHSACFCFTFKKAYFLSVFHGVWSEYCKVKHFLHRTIINEFASICAITMPKNIVRFFIYFCDFLFCQLIFRVKPPKMVHRPDKWMEKCPLSES